MNGRLWTAEDDTLLSELWQDEFVSPATIARRLSRTRDAVQMRVRDLKLSARSSAYRNWSKSEDAFMRANYSTMKRASLAAKLNRSEDACYRRAKVLKLVVRINRTPSVFQARKLTEEAVGQVLELNRQGMSAREIGRQLRIATSLVQAFVNATSDNLPEVLARMERLGERADNNQPLFDGVRGKDRLAV